MAPHPGDLDKQIEREQIGLDNAEYAAAFWAEERDAHRRRLDELRRMKRDQEDVRLQRRHRIEAGRDQAEMDGDLKALYGQGEDLNGDGVDREA